MRVYKPIKPHKYHIRSYQLVETKTGYLSNIFLHDAANLTEDEIVITLIANSPYKLNEGHAYTQACTTPSQIFSCI